VGVNQQFNPQNAALAIECRQDWSRQSLVVTRHEGREVDTTSLLNVTQYSTDEYVNAVMVCRQ